MKMFFECSRGDAEARRSRLPEIDPGSRECGFGLAEFLVSAVILLVIAASVFSLLAEVQRRSSYQAEVQSVLNNTRIAIQAIGRYLRQSGNDPLGAGFPAITIVSPTELRIQSDLTGSQGPGNPDKGDPDGDTNDSGENVTVRLNSATRSLEIVPEGASAQIVAAYISDLSFRYYGPGGAVAATGEDVRKINVTITGVSPSRDPVTHKNFGIQLSSDFQVLPREIV